MFFWCLLNISILKISGEDYQAKYNYESAEGKKEDANAIQ